MDLKQARDAWAGRWPKKRASLFFVPGMLTHVTLHNPPHIQQSRSFPTFKVEKMAAFPRSRRKETSCLGSQWISTCHFRSIWEGAFAYIISKFHVFAQREAQYLARGVRESKQAVLNLNLEELHVGWCSCI